MKKLFFVHLSIASRFYYYGESKEQTAVINGVYELTENDLLNFEEWAKSKRKVSYGNKQYEEASIHNTEVFIHQLNCLSDFKQNVE